MIYEYNISRICVFCEKFFAEDASMFGRIVKIVRENGRAKSRSFLLHPPSGGFRHAKDDRCRVAVAIHARTSRRWTAGEGVGEDGVCGQGSRRAAPVSPRRGLGEGQRVA